MRCVAGPPSDRGIRRYGTGNRDQIAFSLSRWWTLGPG
jgi:hypothetical protein